jgi:hypothetical protein
MCFKQLLLHRLSWFFCNTFCRKIELAPEGKNTIQIAVGLLKGAARRRLFMASVVAQMGRGGHSFAAEE